MPGAFHLLWQVLQGIWSLFGRGYLLPVARLCGRSPAACDAQCTAKNYRTSCDFVHHYATAGLRLISRWGMEGGGKEPEDLMKECRQNRPLHNFIFIVFKYLCPYVELHKAVRSGSHEKVASLMPIFLELFILTKKVKYVRLDSNMVAHAGDLRSSMEENSREGNVLEASQERTLCWC